MSHFGSFFSTLTKKSLSPLLNKEGILVIQLAGIKYYPPPKPVDSSEWPKERRLKTIEKQPNYGSIKAPKMEKMLRFIRGPEEVHTELIYKGYGVKALMGGRLHYHHFETIRRATQKRLDYDRMFMLWRVDPPWQPCTKRGIGKKLGGGKGSIHHYVTPVKAERIIVELGGDLDIFEARRILNPIAEMLPFAARFVSHESLQQEKREEKWIEENNINPFTMEYVIKNNLGGCHKWLSPYDFLWFGKYK